MLKNKINGKIYIGQTIRLMKRRLEEHRSGESSKCRALYSAIKKYGWDNFEKDYYECPDEDLNFDEEFLVREMMTISPNGYNLREGGGNRGKHSEESKQKNREAHLGEKNPNFGVPKSKDTKQKIGEAKLGDKNHNSKRIYQYHLNFIFITSFGSCGEAGRYLDKDASAIRACARGKYKTAYKFKWSYTFPFV